MYLQREIFLGQCSLQRSSCFPSHHFSSGLPVSLISLSSIFWATFWKLLSGWWVKWNVISASSLLRSFGLQFPCCTRLQADLLCSICFCQPGRGICLEQPWKPKEWHCLNKCYFNYWHGSKTNCNSKIWDLGCSCQPLILPWVVFCGWLYLLLEEEGGWGGKQMENWNREMKILSPQNLELKTKNITVFRKIRLLILLANPAIPQLVSQLWHPPVTIATEKFLESCFCTQILTARCTIIATEVAKDSSSEHSRLQAAWFPLDSCSTQFCTLPLILEHSWCISPHDLCQLCCP